MNIFSLMPIIAFIVLVTVFNVKINIAAIISFILAAAVGLFIMDSGAVQIIINCGEGLWNSIIIFVVIFSALLLNNVMDKSGTLENISQFIEDNIKDETNRILLVGGAFTSFLQGITGFGVPVAVATPILVKFGVSPVKSVVICILGHAWGGTFGTLGIAWNSMFMQLSEGADVYMTKTILLTCILIGVYNFVSYFIIFFIINGRKKVRIKSLSTVILISTIQSLGQLLFAYINVNLACFLASALSMAAVYLIDRWQHHGIRLEQDNVIGKTYIWSKDSCKTVKPGLFNIFFPFITLGIIVIVILSPTPLNSWLETFKFGILLPDLTAGDGSFTTYGSINIFTHSATVLTVLAIISFIYYRFKNQLIREDVRHIFRSSFKKSLNVIVSILFLVMTSRVMTGTGQMDILAEYIGQIFGRFFGFASPFIGILGSFISSSNMSSNIMFTSLQFKIAQINGIDTAVILAAQTAGGAVGNLVSTSNIVLGLTTVN